MNPTFTIPLTLNTERGDTLATIDIPIRLRITTTADNNAIITLDDTHTLTQRLTKAIQAFTLALNEEPANE